MNNTRDALFEKLVTNLEGMTKTNGYNFDIGTVNRNLPTLESLDITKFPAIFPIDAGVEIPEGFDVWDPRPGHKLEIPCMFYFREHNKEALESEFSKFVSDLVKWVYSNPSFAPQADNFHLISIETILADPPDKIGILTIGLTYWFDRSAP